MKLTQTQIVFAIVTVYIVAAFGWWTYAHVRSSNELYLEQKDMLELLCYKATLEVNGAAAQEMFNDTNDMKRFLSHNFPQLEVIYDQTLSPLDNFLIRPTIGAYEELENKHNRAVRMYALEGLVMMGLLFWGIIWIYRNLQNKLRLRRQQSNFLLSITHELKTPLASLKLYLDTLLKRELGKEQTQTILVNSQADVMRLRELVENILTAAQLDTQKYELQLYETNITVLINQIVERFSLPRNLAHRIRLNLEQEVFMDTDVSAFEIILNNLLTNAVKYSPPDGFIDIVLTTQDSVVKLCISDEGAGIKDAEKELVFSQFYRSGDEQTRKTKGTGLGLFIVKNLLNLMGAEIKVKKNQTKGTTFELSFQYA